MEGRKNIRVPFRVKAEINLGEKMLDSEIRDLSTNGLFVLLTGPLQPALDRVLDITLFLEDIEDKNKVTVQGTVVRVEKNGFAVSFLGMDLDSFIHLRNIVAYNTYDQQKIIHDFEDSFRDGTPD